MTDIPARRRIVVGVDGSLPSLFALRWAGREARLRGAELCAVTVDADADTRYAPYAPPPPATARAERWSALRRTLADSISTALGPCPDVAVHEHVEEGKPVAVLARFAADAELLVLGSRQQYGDLGPALSPIVRSCIRTVTCPVVVINHDDGLFWGEGDRLRESSRTHHYSGVS